MSRQQTPEDETRDEQTEMACVIGGDHIGKAVADRLNARGVTVTYVDQSESVEPPPDVTFEAVDRLDSKALQKIEPNDPAVVLVAGSTDSQNLLLTQLVRTRFDPEQIITFVNNPERSSVFDDLCVRTIETPQMLAEAVTEHV